MILVVPSASVTPVFVKLFATFVFVILWSISLKSKSAIVASPKTSNTLATSLNKLTLYVISPCISTTLSNFK